MNSTTNMKTTRTILTLMAFLLVSSVLLAGCNSSTVPPADNGDEDQNWQTYENEEWGFNLQYPEGWVYFQEREDRLPPEMLVSVSFDVKNAEYNNTIDFSILEESVEEILRDESTVQQSREQIVKNGISWIKVIDQDKNTPMMFATFLTNQNNKTYLFSVIYSYDGGESQNESRMEVLEQMMGNFQIKD